MFWEFRLRYNETDGNLVSALNIKNHGILFPPLPFRYKKFKIQAAGWQTGPINCPAMPCLSASCTPTQYLMQQSILTSLLGANLPLNRTEITCRL